MAEKPILNRFFPPLRPALRGKLQKNCKLCKQHQLKMVSAHDVDS
jgi:hypothetical protein